MYKYGESLVGKIAKGGEVGEKQESSMLSGRIQN
jgi:hypothetical protein